VLGVGGHVWATHHRIVHRDDAVARHEQQAGCTGGRVPAACARGPERSQTTPLRGDNGQIGVPDGRIRRHAHHEHKEQKRQDRNSRT